MTLSRNMLALAFAGVAGAVGGGIAPEVRAQVPPASGIPHLPLPDSPVDFGTAEGQGIRVSVVAVGLTYPWGFAFLPDGRILVTERLGSLRVIRDGRLEAAALAGVPEVYTGQALAGLMDVSLHPEFAQNRWVYLTYSQTTENGAAVALARGRLDGAALIEVRDLFVSNTDGGVGRRRTDGLGRRRASVSVGRWGFRRASDGGARPGEPCGQDAASAGRRHGTG